MVSYKKRPVTLSNTPMISGKLMAAKLSLAVAARMLLVTLKRTVVVA